MRPAIDSMPEKAGEITGTEKMVNHRLMRAISAIPLQRWTKEAFGKARHRKYAGDQCRLQEGRTAGQHLTGMLTEGKRHR